MRYARLVGRVCGQDKKVGSYTAKFARWFRQEGWQVVCLPYPNSVSLSQSNRVGQLNLNLSTMEWPKHSHHLQQAVIQPARGRRRTLMPPAGLDAGRTYSLDGRALTVWEGRVRPPYLPRVGSLRPSSWCCRLWCPPGWGAPPSLHPAPAVCADRHTE